MKLDRSLQREMLGILRGTYPRPEQCKLFESAGCDSERDEQIVANLLYLEEHGLVRSGIEFSLGGSVIYQGNATITAAGLDFLEDDGGLTAILGTVTVKLHADSIRDLMLSKVEVASMPTEEKSRLKKAISTMSGEALKEVTKKLVAAGMESAPDAVAYIRILLGA
ncbi:hypothetical protein [Variovorax saccharolyticus]|uniref:hypothetical protein n=1 Tax=Variovorax saccharolyticus TaxID=3053516 RepID=UPI00257492A3|nr:hypothetical protein [Variovorax sp. J31P216]MDM0025919.1 hypothetical protein [Variovorax sp. J31P216]